MHRWFLLPLIFLVSGGSYEIYFTLLSQEELFECLHAHLSNYEYTCKSQEIDMNDIVKRLSNKVAESFHGRREKDAGELETMLTDNVMPGLRLDFKDDWRMDYFEDILEDTVIEALITNCADYTVADHYHTNNQPCDNILNFILITWRRTIYDMAQTRNGLFLLRRYSRQAKKLLTRLFSRYDHEEFRILIRAQLMVTIQPFFESSIRNHRPPVTQEDIDSLLNIYIADRSSNNYECDLFNVYARNGMSEIEYYIERQINQFYRVLLFVEELQARNALIDDDGRNLDEQEDPALYYEYRAPEDEPIRLPEEVTEILRDDTVYRDHLIRLRLTYQSSNGNLHGRNLLRRSRVWEEDLIDMMMTENCTIHIHSTTTAAPNVTTTTSSTDVPPTNKRKKESICETTGSKRFKIINFENCCDCQNEQSGTNSKFTESCLKQDYNYNVTQSEDIALLACNVICVKNQKNQLQKSYFGFIIAHGISADHVISIEESTKLVKSALTSFHEVTESRLPYCSQLVT